MNPVARTRNDFALAYVAATITWCGLNYVFALLTNGKPGGGWAGITAILLAIFFVAERYAKRNGEVPDSATAWRLALSFATVSIPLSFGLTVLLVIARVIEPQLIHQQLYPVFQASVLGLGIGILIVSIATFVITRVGFPLAVGSAIARQQRRAAAKPRE